MDVEIMAYLGGLWEGEGYAGVLHTNPIVRGRRYKRDQPRVSLAMTDEEPVVLMRDAFKGSIHIERRNHPKWKTCYHWHAGGMYAAEAAMKLYPFVVARRRKQALLDVINFYLLKSPSNMARIQSIAATKRRVA